MSSIRLSGLELFMLLKMDISAANNKSRKKWDEKVDYLLVVFKLFFLSLPLES